VTILMQLHKDNMAPFVWVRCKYFKCDLYNIILKLFINIFINTKTSDRIHAISMASAIGRCFLLESLEITLALVFDYFGFSVRLNDCT